MKIQVLECHQRNSEAADKPPRMVKVDQHLLGDFRIIASAVLCNFTRLSLQLCLMYHRLLSFLRASLASWVTF